MNYRDFEIRLSGESPNHYIAKAMDNANAITSQTFELRTGELKAFNKSFEEIRRKHDT